jgi:hypothetical protein
LPNSFPFLMITPNLSISPCSPQNSTSLPKLCPTYHLFPLLCQTSPLLPNYAKTHPLLPNLSHFFHLCSFIHFFRNFYPFFIFLDLCPTPPITPNYAKLFQKNPSLCPPFPFMSNYANSSTFLALLLKFPTFAQLFIACAKIILFFSILPNLSTFAPVML